jgi:hypothetical protein
VATVTIADDGMSRLRPDDPQTYVCQHYHDALTGNLILGLAF